MGLMLYLQMGRLTVESERIGRDHVRVDWGGCSDQTGAVEGLSGAVHVRLLGERGLRVEWRGGFAAALADAIQANRVRAEERRCGPVLHLSDPPGRERCSEHGRDFLWYESHDRPPVCLACQPRDRLTPAGKRALTAATRDAEQGRHGIPLGPAAPRHPAMDGL